MENHRYVVSVFFGKAFMKSISVFFLVFGLLLALFEDRKENADFVSSSRGKLRRCSPHNVPELPADCPVRKHEAPDSHWRSTCTFICVRPDPRAGLGHRLSNAAQSTMLSIAAQLPRASFSFESTTGGPHGDYTYADELFYVEESETKGETCSEGNVSPTRYFLPQPTRNDSTNFENLGKWVSAQIDARQIDIFNCKRPNLLIVDEFWPASYESVWSEMNRLYHPSSELGARLRSELLFSHGVFSIALHVRVGDLVPTPLAYFAPCLENVFTAIRNSKAHCAIDVWLFAENQLPGLEAQLQDVTAKFPPSRFRGRPENIGALHTFVHLTEANILIGSDSSFSWFASYMAQDSVVVVAPQQRTENYRSYLGDRMQHILANVKGDLISDTRALRHSALFCGSSF